MDSAALDQHQARVEDAWIDYNGHMNVAYYVLAFDRATDVLFRELGVDESFVRHEQGSFFTLEMNVSYLRELVAGDPYRITTQLVDFDDKRLHYYHRMYHAENHWLAASNECLSLYVDMRQRSATHIPPTIERKIEAMWRSHRSLDLPDNMNRRIHCKHSRLEPQAT